MDIDVLRLVDAKLRANDAVSLSCCHASIGFGAIFSHHCSHSISARALMTRGSERLAF